MSYYESQQPWSGASRQPSWEQQAPPSRSGMVDRDSDFGDAGITPYAGASSTVQGQQDTLAFQSQFDEVEKALENMQKSGKGFPGPFPGPFPGRRDSMPIISGRPYPDYDPRMGPPQRHSISDYDGARPHSANNLQNYYSNQRYQGRQNEPEQMVQAKRRMAAARERELRNYHQEQQYNRSISGGSKASERSMSPNMTEDERRELIARQHRALYGENSQLYSDRVSSQDVRVSGLRGNSPHAFDPFGMPSQNPGEAAVQMPPREQIPPNQQRSRANSNSSPSSNPQSQSFSLFENAQQSSRTSNSSPTGGSPPRQGQSKAPAVGAVGTIGSRPAQNQASGNKRSTTPLPSPLSYGFTASDQNSHAPGNERSTSTSSNPNTSVPDKGVSLGWGNASGVWGNSGKSLGVQASVWG